MNEQGYFFENLNPPPISRGQRRWLMERRNFLVASSVGAVGLLLLLPKSAYASPVYGAVADYANALGAPRRAARISDYLQERRSSLSSSLMSQVERVNTEMAQSGGFSDLSQSTVYVPRDEGKYLFYPARNVDLFNACVAFLDDRRSSGSEKIALIEGPTLFGMGALAQALARKQPTSVVIDAMLPRESIRTGRGTIKKGYDDDDVLRVNAGTLRSHYTTDGNGTGTVDVTVIKEGGALLAGGTYKLKYGEA